MCFIPVIKVSQELFLDLEKLIFFKINSGNKHFVYYIC